MKHRTTGGAGQPVRMDEWTDGRTDGRVFGTRDRALCQITNFPNKRGPFVIAFAFDVAQVSCLRWYCVWYVVVMVITEK